MAAFQAANLQFIEEQARKKAFMNDIRNGNKESANANVNVNTNVNTGWAVSPLRNGARASASATSSISPVKEINDAIRSKQKDVIVLDDDSYVPSVVHDSEREVPFTPDRNSSVQLSTPVQQHQHHQQPFTPDRNAPVVPFTPDRNAEALLLPTNPPSATGSRSREVTLPVRKPKFQPLVSDKDDPNFVKLSPINQLFVSYTDLYEYTPFALAKRIGFRCHFCSHSLALKNEGPGTIEMLARGLPSCAHEHFKKCIKIDVRINRRMSEIKYLQESDPGQMNFYSFFKLLCKRNLIVDGKDGGIHFMTHKSPGVSPATTPSLDERIKMSIDGRANETVRAAMKLNVADSKFVYTATVESLLGSNRNSNRNIAMFTAEVMPFLFTLVYPLVEYLPPYHITSLQQLCLALSDDDDERAPSGYRAVCIRCKHCGSQKLLSDLSKWDKIVMTFSMLHLGGEAGCRSIPEDTKKKLLRQREESKSVLRKKDHPFLSLGQLCDCIAIYYKFEESNKFDKKFAGKVFVKYDKNLDIGRKRKVDRGHLRDEDLDAAMNSLPTESTGSSKKKRSSHLVSEEVNSMKTLNKANGPSCKDTGEVQATTLNKAYGPSCKDTGEVQATKSKTSIEQGLPSHKDKSGSKTTKAEASNEKGLPPDKDTSDSKTTRAKASIEKDLPQQTLLYHSQNGVDTHLVPFGGVPLMSTVTLEKSSTLLQCHKQLLRNLEFYEGGHKEVYLRCNNCNSISTGGWTAVLTGKKDIYRQVMLAHIHYKECAYTPSREKELIKMVGETFSSSSDDPMRIYCQFLVEVVGFTDNVTDHGDKIVVFSNNESMYELGEYTSKSLDLKKKIDSTNRAASVNPC